MLANTHTGKPDSAQTFLGDLVTLFWLSNMLDCPSVYGLSGHSFDSLLVADSVEKVGFSADLNSGTTIA